MGGIDLISRLILLIRGYVRILICGGSYERFLNLCSNHNILLWDLRPAARGYEANIYTKEFYRLKPLARKCRSRIRIKEKHGLAFFLNRHRKRKVFVLGLCCCGFFIYLLSCRIWNIQVNGNQVQSRETVLEYLEECQVEYGRKKSTIDCKQLAADLRIRFSDFTWVSVKIKGTCLLIDVQENSDLRLLEGREYPDSDLISQVDGEIVKMITRRGTPLKKEGDTVEKGEILVSGRLEITDDSGEVVNYRYCPADGDVYVKTVLTYKEEFPLTYKTTEYTGKERYGGMIKAFGKTFGIQMNTDSFLACDYVGEERPLRLFEDFYLPFSFTWITAREYKMITQTYTREEACHLAEQRLHKFLSEKEEKGVQIFEKNVKIDISATLCRAAGTITVIQKAGVRVGTEKIDLQQERTSE